MAAWFLTRAFEHFAHRRLTRIEHVFSDKASASALGRVKTLVEKPRDLAKAGQARLSRVGRQNGWTNATLSNKLAYEEPFIGSAGRASAFASCIEHHKIR